MQQQFTMFSPTNRVAPHHVRIPKIVMPAFKDGTPGNISWKMFSTSLNKIVLNMNDIEKIFLLKQNLEGESTKLVETV